MTRREVIQRVTALLGGAALAGGDSLAAFTFNEAARAEVMAQGTGAFTAADIALLDEIAETILPQTSTPGAKAAKTGAFIALMVTDTYTDRAQQVFRDGLKKLDDECRSANGVTFMSASPAQRLALAEALDREQKAAMDERQGPPVSRAPIASSSNDDPAHYFRMMKELTLLGFFTSEAGMTQALRYIETPGRYDPCAPHKPGDRIWAGHA
ncbi:MAG: gluconate 2-dehydrogenase subunit 3 family protein [Cyanobacteria bacterium]|nr:gluconate 2-dehydrogenase subunit 3 family protein [Cyanobacteriota bacterium]